MRVETQRRRGRLVTLKSFIYGSDEQNKIYEYRHSLYKRVFNKGGFQIPTTCLLQYLNTVRNGLHLAIVIGSKLLSLPANYAYPEVYEQTAVYNSSVGVFINTKKHILCIQLHKIFQVCGNV
uniref:Uncharacterized protein n=1 Tax=Catharus ustulatus TaxID=91951 RepID=A0A8C3V3R4_CATUS